MKIYELKLALRTRIAGETPALRRNYRKAAKPQPIGRFGPKRHSKAIIYAKNVDVATEASKLQKSGHFNFALTGMRFPLAKHPLFPI
jgi:hypothetical protein